MRNFVAVETGKTGLGQGTGYLPGPVGTEIKKQHSITIINGSGRADHPRLNKLIGLLRGIGRRNRFGRVGSLLTDSFGQHQVGLFHSLPAIITIHGPVTAANRDNSTKADVGKLLFQLLQVAGTAFRRRITAIHESMDADILDADFLSHAHQCVEVGIVGMDAAIGQQSK